MSFKISNNLLYQLLFAICIGVTYLNIYELNFAVWIIAILLSIKRKISLNLVIHILPFIGIIVVAFLSSFRFENTLYNIVRDLTYLIKPIIGILAGYQLCRNIDINPFKTIVYTGIFIASIHFYLIFYSIIVHHISNIHDLRAYSGYFSDFEIFALIISINHKEFELKFDSKKATFIILFLGISSFLYLSRTNFIQFGVFYFVLKGYLNFTKKSVSYFFLLFFLTLSSYFLIFNMHLSRNGSGLEALLFKIKNAPIEAFKTKIDKDDWQDFNDNYRSYENIIAVNQIFSSGIGAILFGEGVGSRLNLTRRVLSNDGEYVQFIPYVHNGYMTVFLKSGITGVVFLILFLIKLLQKTKSTKQKPILSQLNLLILATGIYMIIVNWVLLGLYLKLDNKAVIIGFLIAFREMIIREHNNKNVLINE